MGTNAKQSATPARARVDADEGVTRCVDLMTSGQWVTGRSHRDVALKFGVSPATVKDWATSASRIIRLAVEGDREDIRARMLATLDTVISGAMTREVPVGDAGETLAQPDGRVAVAAIETQAKLLGLVETKHRVDVTVQAFAQLEPPAMLSKVREQIAELQRLERQLSEQVEAIPVLAQEAR